MSQIDLDALLDGNLSEVEAAPEFVTPPTGFYIVGIVSAVLEPFDKKVRDDQGNETGATEPAARIRITRQLVEVKEYADDDAVPVAPGSLYSDSYMYDERGQSMFKRDVGIWLGADESEVGSLSLRDLFTVLEDSEPQYCLVKTTSTTRGQNTYTNTSTRPMAEE